MQNWLLLSFQNYSETKRGSTIFRWWGRRGPWSRAGKWPVGPAVSEKRLGLAVALSELFDRWPAPRSGRDGRVKSIVSALRTYGRTRSPDSTLGHSAADVSCHRAQIQLLRGIKTPATSSSSSGGGGSEIWSCLSVTDCTLIADIASYSYVQSLTCWKVDDYYASANMWQLQGQNVHFWGIFDPHHDRDL